MSRPNVLKSYRIPREMEEAADFPVFESASTHDGRIDLTDQLHLLQDENSALRRQVAELARHIKALRTTRMLEKRKGVLAKTYKFGLVDDSTG